MLYIQATDRRRKTRIVFTNGGCDLIHPIR